MSYEILNIVYQKVQAIHFHSGRLRPEQFPETGKCSDFDSIDRSHGFGTFRISNIIFLI